MEDSDIEEKEEIYEDLLYLRKPIGALVIFIFRPRARAPAAKVKGQIYA